MNDFGTIFAVSYLVLAAIPLLAALAFTRRLRNRRHDGEPLKTIYQVAALAGGPERVADTAIAGAVEREEARLDSAGTLRRTSARPTDPFGAEVGDALPKMRTARVREPVCRSEPMRSLWAELLADGLVIPEDRLRRAWRNAVLAYLALWAVGAAWFVRAVLTGQSVPFAGAVLTLATAAFVATVRLARSHRDVKTTTAGQLALEQASGDPDLVTGAMGAVALDGLAAYPDRDLAKLLTLATPFPMGRRAGRIRFAASGTGGGLMAVTQCSSGCSTGASCGGGSGCGGGGGGCGGGGGP